MNLTIEKIKNIALTEIENHLLSNGCSLKKWPHMPKPEDFGSYNGNRLIDDDLKYVVEDQLKENERLMAMITDEQRGVYEQILDAVLNDSGGVFFLYGYGGTGKTFVYRALSSAIRSRGMIVLNTASSGIAALLLEGGRTAHSRFGIPIDADEFSTCKKMEPGSDRAELVKAAKLIVWDEVPMMSRHCFETLDRTMRDIIRSSENKPFGGKVIVFGGDFRQILPVIPGGGRAETVLAVLNSSYLWEHCKVLKLTKNMRLLAGLTDDAAKELQSFSNWILDIGDGKINLPNDGQVEIDIPSDLLIQNSGEHPIETMAKEVYGQDFQTSTDKDLYRHRAILTPTNDEVDKINDFMLMQLPGEEKVYLSSDSIIPSDVDIDENLKVGAPIMCLRNMDVADGLCNGTRLIVTQLLPHVIEGRIITGNKIAGHPVWIPRMFVTPPDTKFPFRMRRRRFPVTLAFAMTINKSQGPTLESVGLFLPSPVFSHGQLYVALSRVK
ncbi:ATP-dependent DNA helicase PIF1-like, partial [Brassica napus]|uniref:ATP-dependent DNA helicase PIF1-like n=1 Tax=Brassica napus TaxID=3708 RepID=UPI0020787E94